MADDVAPADSRKEAPAATGEPASPAAPDRFRWLHRGGILNRPRILPSVFDLRQDTRAQSGSGAPGGGDRRAPAVSSTTLVGSPSPEAPVAGAREGVPILQWAEHQAPVSVSPEPRREAPAPPPEVAGSVDCPFVDDCSELVEKLCTQPGIQDAGTCRLELWNTLQAWVYGKFPPEEFEPRIRAVAFKHGIDLDIPLT